MLIEEYQANVACNEHIRQHQTVTSLLHFIFSFHMFKDWNFVKVVTFIWRKSLLICSLNEHWIFWSCACSCWVSHRNRFINSKWSLCSFVNLPLAVIISYTNSQWLFKWSSARLFQHFTLLHPHLANIIKNIRFGKEVFISSIYKSEPVIYALSGLFFLEWTNESLTTASWIDILTKQWVFALNLSSQVGENC